MLLAACAEGSDKDDACGATGLLAPDSLALTASTSMPTSGTLTLTMQDTADVTVTLVSDTAPTVETTTWPSLSGDVALPIYGMRPDTTYTARVTATSGEACEVGETTITSGSLPAWLPRVTVTTDGDGWGTWTMLAFMDEQEATHTGVLVVDEGGGPVWYWQAPHGTTPNATWAWNSNDLLVRQNSAGKPEDTGVFRVAMSGETLAWHNLPDSHHDIGQAPDIDFAVLHTVVEEVDGEAVAGDEIVEVGLDGAETVVWNAFDCLDEIEHHQNWDADTSPVPDTRDWTHANGLTRSADDGWLTSFYYLHDVRDVGRAGCADGWRLDGDRRSGDFTSPEDASFGPQHSPQAIDGGIVLFDNAYRVEEEDPVSRVMALDLDRRGATASVRWSTPHPDGLQGSLLGSTQPLPDGSTAVGWGIIGDISIVDPDGALVWHASVENAIVGTTERRDSLYGPPEGDAPG